MVQKAQLLELVEQGQAEILRFAGTLNEDEREKSGTLECWEVRDLVTHMAYWKLYSAERIAAAREGKSEDPEPGYQVTNDIIFEQYRSAGWQIIEDLLERSHKGLVDLVHLLSDEEINVPGHFQGQGKEPIWRRIVGDGLSHPMVHIGQAYLDRGEREYCNEMRLREEAILKTLDASPDWQAACQYNLACHWALCGEKQKALASLAFSLRHRPDLIEWSTQDTDLASLHDSAEFLALLDRARKEQQAI